MNPLYIERSEQIHRAGESPRRCGSAGVPLENPFCSRDTSVSLAAGSAWRRSGILGSNISKAFILTFLLTGLAGGAALAGTAPICDFKRQVAAGRGAGSGVSALFSGPPGTGKTMAAKILAAELGMDLYRVDLAAIVSKYIGETEKNLAQLFDKAESANWILLFDEADPLFARRGDVTDAHDRYGNLKIDYMFRQIEGHSVPVILATNLPPAVKPRTRKPPIVVIFEAGQPNPRDQLGKCR